MAFCTERMLHIWKTVFKSYIGLTGSSNQRKQLSLAVLHRYN